MSGILNNTGYKIQTLNELKGYIKLALASEDIIKNKALIIQPKENMLWPQLINIFELSRSQQLISKEVEFDEEKIVIFSAQAKEIIA